MAIHKLATGPLTLTVIAAEQVEGNFGPQVCFMGEGDVAVYISELSATKQLARLNLTLESCVGKTLYMEQIKKDGKTFTNIQLVANGDAVTVAAVAGAAKPSPAAAKPPVDLPSIALLYSECVAIAMATLGAKCEEAGVPIDASAIQAAAATLFIRASK